MTAPASVAAACGVDALIHAMESYINTDANPFAMAMGEKAMELIGGNIRKFVARRNDPDAACAMMLGSTFAGIAFANNRLGDIHASLTRVRFLPCCTRCGQRRSDAHHLRVQRSGC